jgi:hypothetical protein
MFMNAAKVQKERLIKIPEMNATFCEEALLSRYQFNVHL